jgi:YHS domain-containing protein
MRTIRTILLAALLPLIAARPLVSRAEDTPKAAEPTKTVTSPDAGAYPLDHCIVSGEKFGGEMGAPVSYNYQGRDLKFCCKGCIKDFEKNPAKYTKKLDDAIIALQKDNYPLTTCPVSGEKLGGMGDPVDYVYNNQLVRLCCKGCIKTLEKDPATYMDKLSAAKLAKEKATATESTGQ